MKIKILSVMQALALAFAALVLSANTAAAAGGSAGGGAL